MLGVWRAGARTVIARMAANGRSHATEPHADAKGRRLCPEPSSLDTLTPSHLDTLPPVHPVEQLTAYGSQSIPRYNRSQPGHLAGDNPFPTEGCSAMECISVINQKGGVGKTSTAVNLGAALAQRDKRMLLVDLDPQGHLTAHFGMDHVAAGAGIYEVLTRDLPLESAMHPVAPNITIIPAQIDLAAAEMELVSVVGREVIMRDLLAAQAWPYDMVLIDCPPSLGVLTLNALAASTHVLIPLQPHFLALQGVGRLLETVSLVSKRINPQLKVAGMVMCMYEAGTRLAGEVGEDLSSFITAARGTKVPWGDARIFNSKIRRNVKLAEAPSYGQSIFGYAPRCNGATDYLDLADELIGHLAGTVETPAAVTKPEKAAETQPIAVTDASTVPIASATASVQEVPPSKKAAEAPVVPAAPVSPVAPLTPQSAPVAPVAAAPVTPAPTAAPPAPPKRRPPTRKPPEVTVPQAVATE